MARDDEFRQPEPLTPEEKERFLARARAEGRTLSSAEQYAIFGPPPEAAPTAPVYEAAPMEAAPLDEARRRQLEADFFPELGNGAGRPPLRLVQGIIFDFDDTLAHLAQPLAELMVAGAQSAEAYMRAAGMDDLPPDFAPNIVEARRFAEEKSRDEAEEHLADDALSFLLQFYGYPASRMNPDVLRQAVDIFYAPEMTAWRLAPHARRTLQALVDEGYKLALLANYNCDRVFQRTIDYLGLRPYFDVCLCSAAVEYRKPDARFFQIVLDRWDALPYEVVVVGDSLVDDVGGGLELGSLAVWLDGPNSAAGPASAQVAHQNEVYRGQITPDAVIRDLGELPALVTQWSV